MLPEAYFIDDQKWIASQIKQLPVHLWDKAAESYAKVYLDAYEKGGSREIIKIQMARETANTRLRNYVKAVNNERTNKGTNQ